MADMDNTEIVNEDGISVLHGSMKIDGNLEVRQQLEVNDFKVVNGGNTELSITKDKISFKTACEFKDNVEFNNGKTIIGLETTYNSAYVGSPTIQAGDRLIIGDSSMKIDADSRSIIADTFNMTLRNLDVDTITSKKTTSTSIDTKDIKVTGELIGNKLYADTIKTNNLQIENITGLNIKSGESITTKDLIVGGTAKVQNDVVIMGSGSANGAALTVNGGELVANKGIVSHTGNNRFQTMQIMGSGQKHETCFTVDRYVDSVFQGDVTVQDSNLILDNSKLVSDNIIVTPISQVTLDAQTNGVQLATDGNWNQYKDSMVEEIEASNTGCLDYDPVKSVANAMERNANNYTSAGKNIKSLLNPINYLMEQNNPNVPKRFNVKSGVYRIDANGNALMKNVVSEKGQFSSLEAYKLKVNQFAIDKMVSTSVASNVVHTDNLLKAEGLVEIDGSVSTKADIFIEEGSSVDVASGTNVTFQDGASLTLKNGSKFEMGTDTFVKMSGDIELDLDKLVFFDSKTGNKYKISFREAHECEGMGIVMDYAKVDSVPTQELVEETSRSAMELNEKLKSLGL